MSAMLAAFTAAVFAGSTGSSIAAVQRDERWQNLHYAAGRLGAQRLDDPCDFNRRLRVSRFDLLVGSNQVAFALPSLNSTGSTRCPSASRDLAITRVGFSRGSRSVIPGGGANMVSAAVMAMRDLLGPKSITRYFLSLDYREPGGDAASAIFYFEGKDPASLLTSLSRIGNVPVEVTAPEAARLGRDVRVSVSPDPHRRLLPNIPLWHSQALALEGRVSDIVPDGSAAFAHDALWELPTGTLRRRLARPPEHGALLQELLTGDGRWLVSAYNSGPLNGKNAMRAGEVTIVDTTATTTVTRVGQLPWINHLLLAPEAGLALAFVAASAPNVGSQSAVSAIAIDEGRVVWRDSVPVGRAARLGRSDASRILAFGSDWIRLWQGTTGESLFDSIAALKQLPADRPPVVIVNVASLKDRILVVYDTKAGKHIASMDMSSGRVVNSAQLSGTRGFRTSWSPNGNVLLVASPDRVSLWDTNTLRPLGELNGDQASLSVEFDASGELLAAMRYSAQGLDRHVVITDVRTLTPVGQCLLGDADAMRLASDGRTVLGYHGNTVLSCRRGD